MKSNFCQGSPSSFSSSCNTWLDNYISLVVNNHMVQLLCRVSPNKVTNLIRQRSESTRCVQQEPPDEMCPTTLTTYFLLCYLYSTTVTNNSFISDTLLYLPPVAFVIFDTAQKYARKTIHHVPACMSTVIDCFRLQNFTT